MPPPVLQHKELARLSSKTKDSKIPEVASQKPACCGSTREGQNKCLLCRHLNGTVSESQVQKRITTLSCKQEKMRTTQCITVCGKSFPWATSKFETPRPRTTLRRVAKQWFDSAKMILMAKSWNQNCMSFMVASKGALESLASRTENPNSTGGAVLKIHNTKLRISD